MRKTRLVILPGVRSLNTIGCLLLFLACPNIAFKGQENRDIDTFCKAETFKQFWLQDTLEPGDGNVKKPDDIFGNGQRLGTEQAKLCDPEAPKAVSAGTEAASRFAREDRSRRFESRRTERRSDDNAGRSGERRSEVSRRNDRLDWERSLRMDRSDARRERTREINNNDLRMKRIGGSADNRRDHNVRERLSAEERRSLSARRMSEREVERSSQEARTKRSADERGSFETQRSRGARVVTTREEIRANRRENIRQRIDDYRINERRTERMSRSEGGVTEGRRTERNARSEERAMRSADGQVRFERNSRRIESKSPSTGRVITERERIDGRRRETRKSGRSESRETEASRRLVTRRLAPSSEQLRVTRNREMQNERQIKDVESASLRMQARHQRSLDRNSGQPLGSRREQSEDSRSDRVRRGGVDRRLDDRQMPESRERRILAEQRSSMMRSTETGINRRLVEEDIRRTRSERDIRSSNLSRMRLDAREPQRREENDSRRQTDGRRDMQQRRERETKFAEERRADQRRNDRTASDRRDVETDRRLSSVERDSVKARTDRTRSASLDVRSVDIRSRNELNRRRLDEGQKTFVGNKRLERERSESQIRGRTLNSERNRQVQDGRRNEENRLRAQRREENMRRLQQQSENLGPARARLDERRAIRQSLSVDDLTAYRRMTRDERQVREKRDTQRRLSVTEDSSRVDNIRRNEAEARRELDKNMRTRSIGERTASRMATRGDRLQLERRDSQNNMARSARQQDGRRDSVEERRTSRVDRFIQERRASDMRDLHERDSSRVAETARTEDSVRRFAERRNNRRSAEEQNVSQTRILSVRNADRRTRSEERSEERRNSPASPTRSMSGNRGERLVREGRDERRSERRAAEIRISERRAADVRQSDRQTTDQSRFERQAADIRQTERQTAPVRESERQGVETRATERRVAEERRVERRAAEMRQSERQAAEERRVERQGADIRRSERQISADMRQSERRAAEMRQSERRAAEMRQSERQTAEERRVERLAAAVRRSERRAADMRQSERRAADMRQSERQTVDARRSERQRAEVRASERRAADLRRSERRSADESRFERRAADMRQTERRNPDVRATEREAVRSELVGRRISNGMVDKREDARFENDLFKSNRRNYRERIFLTNKAERLLGDVRMAKLENAQDSNEERIKRDVLSMNDYNTFGKQGDEGLDQSAGTLHKTTKDAFSYWLWKLEGLRWTELRKVGETLFYGGIMCYALFSSVNKKKAIFGN